MRVLPPLWRTSLAFAGYGIFVLALTGFSVLRVKRRQRKTLEELARQEDLNAELEKKVQARTSEIEKGKRLAEEATRAKSIFLANMSHEVRTPLNGITGMLSLLRRSGLTEDQLDYLHNCEISVENLTHIVSDLLDLEKIQEGRLVLNREPFSLRGLVENSVLLFRPQAADKDVSLEAAVDPASPDSLVGDRTRITQILGNLLSNAVKYTDTGSIRLEVGCGGSEGTFEFRVIDNGIGFDEESIPQIFDQFSRLTTGPGKAISGVGLGLAIVKQLVHGMGGTIDVRSRPGVGSAFTVTLPLEIESGEEGDKSERAYKALSFAAERGGMKNDDSVSKAPPDCCVEHKTVLKAGVRKDVPTLSGRVLVAEDERINGMYIEQFLAGLGLEVVLAKDGAEEVRMYEEGGYDLILMDIGLPEMTGYEAAEAVREIEKSRAGGAPGVDDRVPIIALTAHAYPEDIAKCFAAGMDSFVSKPITELILLGEMAKYLSE